MVLLLDLGLCFKIMQTDKSDYEKLAFFKASAKWILIEIVPCVDNFSNRV